MTAAKSTGGEMQTDGTERLEELVLDDRHAGETQADRRKRENLMK
jgi:hypothetical protein